MGKLGIIARMRLLIEDKGCITCDDLAKELGVRAKLDDMSVAEYRALVATELFGAVDAEYVRAPTPRGLGDTQASILVDAMREPVDYCFDHCLVDPDAMRLDQFFAEMALDLVKRQREFDEARGLAVVSSAKG